MLLPVAVTLKVALLPEQTVTFTGWAVMLAGSETVKVTAVEVTLDGQLFVTITR